MIRYWPILLMLCSCSLVMRNQSTSSSAKGKQYQLIFNLPGWVEKTGKPSDYVFENENGSVLLSNSFCGEYQNEDLGQLARKTFKTMESFKSIKGLFTSFRHREAYRMEGTGIVNDVHVVIHFLNTKRNDCYIDFVSITPVLKSENPIDHFNKFLDSVEFK